MVPLIRLENCANLQNFYSLHTILNPTLTMTTFRMLITLHYMNKDPVLHLQCNSAIKGNGKLTYLTGYTLGDTGGMHIYKALLFYHNNMTNLIHFHFHSHFIVS
jgi:hypothetical protein